MKEIEITDDYEKKVNIGKLLYSNNANIYTPRRTKIIYDIINSIFNNLSKSEIEKKFFHSLYNYWMYGSDVNEEYYLHFDKLSHNEKQEYITFRTRYDYIYHLNNKEIVNKLSDKYETYKLLKKYYKREVIRVNDEDYLLFNEFVKKHKTIVVKPSDLAQGIGVTKVSLSDFKNIQTMFDYCISINRDLDYSWGGKRDFIIEELIEQQKDMEVLHKESVNTLRMNVIRNKNGAKLFYPWLKYGNGSSFVDNAGSGGGISGIDIESGKTYTDGYCENTKIDKCFPKTNISIKGFTVPDWEKAKSLCFEAIEQLPAEIGIVGFDIAYSNNGWVIVECNPLLGINVAQLFLQKGIKKELECLLEWTPNKRYWWEQ